MTQLITNMTTPSLPRIVQDSRAPKGPGRISELSAKLTNDAEAGQNSALHWLAIFV